MNLSGVEGNGFFSFCHRPNGYLAGNILPRVMKSVPPRGSGWVRASKALQGLATRYREVVLTSFLSINFVAVQTSPCPKHWLPSLAMANEKWKMF